MVFATRLRETRIARRLTQAELAGRMTEAGYRSSRTAVLQIEKGGRAVSLDEALGLAFVLQAVPAHLLSPVEGAWVMPISSQGFDAEGMRAWLRHGDFSAEVAPESTQPLSRPEQRVVDLARALEDATDRLDRQAQKEALFALIDAARHPRSKASAHN